MLYFRAAVKVLGSYFDLFAHQFLQANINAEKLPLFQNLTFLECEADADMCELLQSAPNLKSLVLFDVSFSFIKEFFSVTASIIMYFPTYSST